MIPWNFSKFLLNSQGEVVRFFDPYDDLEEIQVEVEALLWLYWFYDRAQILNYHSNYLRLISFLLIYSYGGCDQSRSLQNRLWASSR